MFSQTFSFSLFVMFLMTQTPSHNIQENLLAPHRQREAAALFLNRNLCSILKTLFFRPLSTSLKHNRTSLHSALLLPHRITSVDIVVIQTANVKPAITQSVGFYVPSLSLSSVCTSIHPLTHTWLLTEDHSVCQAFLFISVQTLLFKMHFCALPLACLGAATSLPVFAEDKPPWHKIRVLLQRNCSKSGQNELSPASFPSLTLRLSETSPSLASCKLHEGWEMTFSRSRLAFRLVM